MEEKKNKELAFSYNWNGKLNSKSFTTIRLHNPSKFKLGEVFNVTLEGVFKGKAEIIDIKHIRLDQINNYISYLDTGCDPDSCKEMLRKMYKNKPIDWGTQRLDFCLFKYVEQSQQQRLF